jgi:hypothetical protein
MAREVQDYCSSCGVGFVIGPLFVDYISQLRRRGLHRTLGFDYRFYSLMFGYDDVESWPSDVTLADCDSIFLGDLIDPDMECPKCKSFAFMEAGD